MTNTFKDALAGNILALSDTLIQAKADATYAVCELQSGNLRAAVGAVVPISQALRDAKALVEAIGILNRYVG